MYTSAFNFNGRNWYVVTARIIRQYQTVHQCLPDSVSYIGVILVIETEVASIFCNNQVSYSQKINNIVTVACTIKKTVWFIHSNDDSYL